MIAIIALITTLQSLDSKFCPAAPSPEHYQDTIGIEAVGGRLTKVPDSAQVAARLVDTRLRSAPTIGWLYIDDHAHEYVALIPNVSQDLYVAFNMPAENHRRRNDYTETVLQETPLRLPEGIIVESCTQPYGG